MTLSPVFGLRPLRGGRWLIPKLPKPRDLDPITVGEVAGYFIKNCTNRKIDIVGRELGELGGKLLDKFGACHSK